MQYSSRRFADVVVAAPAGRIDHANAEEFSRALAPELNDRENRSALLLDFAGVDYISSVGLRALMVAAKRLRADQRRIAIAALQPIVREILQISRFDLILDVFPSSVRDALAQLSTPALAAYDVADKRGPP
jgi:anti-sigma B factor antagonist/stage II sporulation protein AA (anti-sigma F factor antagonist)